MIRNLSVKVRRIM